MNIETRILTVLLFAALAFPACNKKPIAPEVPASAPVGFRTMSQANWVKAGTADFPYDDFGVWGIARKANVQSPYILWDNFTQVSKDEDSNIYEPTTAAYWVQDYTYHFLAVAPYGDEGFTLTGITQKTSTVNDKLSFSYDISPKYEASNYGFDLLGAASGTTVDRAGYNTAQGITFLHLFTRVRISATFADCDSGSLSRIVLRNVDTQADYAISYDSDGELTVDCISDGETGQMSLEADGETAEFYMVPQDMSDVELYVDFTITINGNERTAENVMINMSNALNGQVYPYNHPYNWNLTITPKTISFEATVTQWMDSTTNPEIEIK